MSSSPSALSRVERKKREMRQEILDSAFACFAEQGYHATGVADIAGRIGIGHGTFYRYFKSKRDIIEHVIDDVTGQIFEAIGAENAAASPTTLSNTDNSRSGSAPLWRTCSGKTRTYRCCFWKPARSTVSCASACSACSPQAIISPRPTCAMVSKKATYVPISTPNTPLAR